MSLDYGSVAAWSKCIDLIYNRCKYANDVVNTREDHGEVARLDYKRGYYRLTWMGKEVAKAKPYDLQQARDLLSFCEGLTRPLYPSTSGGNSPSCSRA